MAELERIDISAPEWFNEESRVLFKMYRNRNKRKEPNDIEKYVKLHASPEYLEELNK